MKFIIFLPIILFFGFFGLLVFGFLLLIFKLISKSKNSSWLGEVTDKKYSSRDDEDGRDEFFYHLVVKTDEGKVIKVGLSKQMWNNFKIGDRITKPKGRLYPQKV